MRAKFIVKHVPIAENHRKDTVQNEDSFPETLQNIFL